MSIKYIKKKEILLRQGELSANYFLVHQGLLRSFFIDDRGKEHIFMFAPERWIVVDNAPYDYPSDLYIDALEDSRVEVFEKKRLFHATNSNVNLPVSTKAFMKRLTAMQKRILMLLSSSAIERYEYFLDTYPEISGRVTQKMIASYLGITPEALSKVKKNRLNKL